MKILMINGVCGIRSTGRICTDLANALEERGHTVKIAYGRETVPEQHKKYAVRIGSEIDVKVHAVMSRILDNTGFESVSVTKKFIKWVEQYDPDVIHLHNIHGYYINIELLFKYLAESNKRVIWTLHDCWAFTGHCTYFTAANCNKWITGCDGKCSCKREYPSSIGISDSSHNWKVKKNLFTHLKNMTIVTPSQWLADLVKQSFLEKYPVKVINNGIDTSVFKPTSNDFRKKYGIEDKKILLGVAAIWHKRKGLNDFIRLSKIIDENYKIVLVGLSDKQINKLPNGIIGISRTDSVQELAGIYTASDVFLNLTYEDNYPTTNLEAQACGTPVITYNTGGSVESVPYNNSVDKADIQSILKMIGNPLEICNHITSTSEFVNKYIYLYENDI